MCNKGVHLFGEKNFSISNQIRGPEGI